MNFGVEIFEGLAAMANHGPRECGESFRRNLDRAGDEKLVVRWQAANVQRSTFNVQH